MANVTVNKPDEIYTALEINKAKNKRCNICGNYITDNEAESKDFHHTKTKRKTDVYIHKHCWGE